MHAFAGGAIEWIEELHLVQQSSWRCLEDGSGSLTDQFHPSGVGSGMSRTRRMNLINLRKYGRSKGLSMKVNLYCAIYVV